MCPKDNRESWRHIHADLQKFQDESSMPVWRQMVEEVVRALEARGLDHLFRIGQGMHDIMFSTLDHHRLTTEPHVTLQFHSARKTVRIAYSYSAVAFNDPLSEVTVPVENALPNVLSYLRRLWAETKPGIPIPDELNPT